MRKDWEVKKLGDVCEISYGNRVVKSRDCGSLYPVYGGGGATFFVDSFNRENAVIVSRFGMSPKCVRFVKGKFFLNDSGLSLIANKNILCQSYLDVAMFALNDTIYSLGKGAAQKNLDVIAFNELSIKYPISFIDQQQIVEELDSLTSIIEKQKKQLEELDNLAQAIFYDMFGDPIENEKGWEVKKMDNICNITSSKRIYSHEYVETGIPFYRGKEITEKCKSLNLSVELFISVEKYEELKENFGVPQIGDLLLTAVGTIGNIWIVDTETPFYFKDGNILWLKNFVNTNPIFFKFLLELQISEFKNKLANGCAYNALTIMNLKILNVIIPPLPLQQQFASKIEAIEKQKELIKKSIKETEDLFNSRMDYYFN